jgi:predicted site-specific integrase-resolvase
MAVASAQQLDLNGLSLIFGRYIYSNVAFKSGREEMAIFGYARVSTRDQDLASQIAELQAAGCGNIFKEKASGAKTDRPELAKAIRRLE